MEKIIYVCPLCGEQFEKQEEYEPHFRKCVHNFVGEMNQKIRALKRDGYHCTLMWDECMIEQYIGVTNLKGEKV